MDNEDHYIGILLMLKLETSLKIGFLQIEIKNARESIAEDLVKIGVTTKEVCLPM
jgi:hypothetical protein